MKLQITRCPQNPIVYPGIYHWRKAVVFNPAVIIDHDKFYMIERAAGSIKPNACFFGLLQSDDGINFTHVKDMPVFTAQQLGYPNGSIQDPRLVKIDGMFYLTYALRRYTLMNGQLDYPERFLGDPESNATQSGIAASKDLIHWEQVAYTSEPGLDDRDHILFPEKINGKFVLMRRPHTWTGPKYGTTGPSIWLSCSDDLKTWTEPKLMASPAFDWENGKIGGSTPPIRTDQGWLVIYHSVERYNNMQHKIEHRGRQIYRVGAMLLDLDDPTKVLARCPHPIMEPETYYEKVGLIIPDVIFPCGNVVKDGILYIYYGCCDTAIALATVNLQELISHLLEFPV